jgi:hypothetical protein
MIQSAISQVIFIPKKPKENSSTQVQFPGRNHYYSTTIMKETPDYPRPNAQNSSH